MNHLTDEQIQEFAEGLMPEKNNEIEEHLKSCRNCRVEVEAYRNLFAELNEEMDSALSNTFVDSVMTKIAMESSAKSKFKYLNILLVALGIVASVFITMQYVDLAAVSKTTMDSIMPNISLQPEQVMSVEQDTAEAFNKYKFFIFCAFVMALIFFLDQIVLGKRIMKNKFVFAFVKFIQ